MSDRFRRFLGVGDDGRVGALSGWHALIAGLVILGGSVWGHNWWGAALMAFMVLRAAITLWLTRKARRHLRPAD